MVIRQNSTQSESENTKEIYDNPFVNLAMWYAQTWFFMMSGEFRILFII